MPQTAIQHMTLALKVLEARYRIGGATINPEDIETLKSYLGASAQGLASDQIACAVIELGLNKLKLARGKSA